MYNSTKNFSRNLVASPSNSRCENGKSLWNLTRRFSCFKGPFELFYPSLTLNFSGTYESADIISYTFSYFDPMYPMVYVTTQNATLTWRTSLVNIRKTLEKSEPKVPNYAAEIQRIKCAMKTSNR